MSLEEEYRAALSSVDRGDDSRKTKLAWFKLSALGGCGFDGDGAVALLEERVKEGEPEAMWMLGLCSEFGIGIEQDFKRAKLLYSQSHDGENEIGTVLMENVGDERERGCGCLRVRRLRINCQIHIFTMYDGFILRFRYRHDRCIATSSTLD